VTTDSKRFRGHLIIVRAEGQLEASPLRTQ